jgi:hypothetical protein
MFSRNHPCRRSNVLYVLAAACMGCAGVKANRVPASVHGPLVTSVDSIRLVEADSLPLGAYTSFFARARDGGVFVNDMQLRRLMHFDSTGRFVGTIGRPGSGPGEFVLPGPLGLLPGDSTIMVVDVNRRWASLFDTRTGRYLRGFGVPFQDIGTNWTVENDTVIFALNMVRTLLGKWALHGDSIVMNGAVPRHLRGEAGVTAGYGRSEVVVTDSNVIALLPTEPGLDIYTRDGKLIGWVPLPAARRRGEPRDLIAQQKRLTRSNPNQVLGSSVAGLHKLSSGMLVAVHLDMTSAASGPRGIRYGDFKLYATLISQDLRQACVDAVIPIASDVPPIPAFVSDTMFVLTRQVLATNQVRSVVRGFVIGSQGCGWVKTGGIQHPRDEDKDPSVRSTP